MVTLKAELIDHMGTDLSVVNAARVSMAKESSWVWFDEDGEMPLMAELSDKDTKLIHYLATHKHWTPFAHTCISMRITAPIFVARQLFKHKVGLVENEVSRRYVDTEPEFYLPETLRQRAPDVKQGSLDVIVGPVELWDGVVGPTGNIWEDPCQLIDHHHDMCLMLYNSLLKAGTCPEQARMVLPQSMVTEWVWTGSLVAFANIYKLRTDSHAQKETGVIAHQIGDICKGLFPVSWEALTA